MSFNNDYEQSLQNTKNLNFFRENRFLYRKSLFTDVFDQNIFFFFFFFFFVIRFSKISLHMLPQTKCSIVPRKYFMHI